MLFHGSELVVEPDFAPLFRAQGVERIEDAFRAWCPEPPKSGQRTRVVELRLPLEGGAAHLFFKAYDYEGASRLRTILVPARVKREFRNLQGLAALGLSVPRPVAYGQRRRLGFVADSFLVTEAVENAIDLRELADGRPAPFPMPGRRERRALITTFARQLRRCHEEGWFLYTAFFKNLLLSHGPGGYALHVIDVPFARIWRSRLAPSHAKVRDLGCLLQGARQILTRAERLRFYRAYAGGGRLSPADRSLLRRVAAYQTRYYP